MCCGAAQILLLCSYRYVGCQSYIITYIRTYSVHNVLYVGCANVLRCCIDLVFVQLQICRVSELHYNLHMYI